MPRKRLPARLRLREREGREPRWCIVDGRTEIDTGCGPGDYKQAQEKLGEYISETREIDTSTRNPGQISVADVIALYIKHHPAPPGCYHATPLLAFFGLKTLRDINGQLCRAYTEQRGVAASTIRRELGTLQAAINHWHIESPLDSVPIVWKPEEGQRRERVLIRPEVAKLLLACRRLSREGYTAGNGATQFQDYSAIARFILIALYTGSRHATIQRLRWYPSTDAGWIDPDKGIIYRAGTEEKQTRKKRMAARMPDRLLAHVRRWARLDLAAGPQAAIIRYKGKPTVRQQRGWEAVVEAAGLGSEVTPHVLKHTASTWLLQAGTDIWDVAGLTSTTVKTIESVYGHHHPEFQKAAAQAFRRRA